MTLITEHMQELAWLLIIISYIFGGWVIITELKSFIRYMFWLFFIADDDDDEYDEK